MSSPTIAEVMATPAFQLDPYPLYARLRDEQPLYRSPHGVAYLSRHADIEKALRDPRLSNDRDRIIRAMQAQKNDTQLMTRLMRKLGRVMTNSDPPYHARLRKLVGKAFNAGRIRDFRPQVQALTDDLLDAAQARGKGMDLIAALAYPLTSTVICALIGLPRDDQARFLAWFRQLEDPIGAGLSIGETEALVDTLYGALRALIHLREREPGDDFLSALVHAEEGGERLDEDELLSACFVLIGSGYETTMNLIANSVFTLLRHPDQLCALQEKPELLPQAIEEVLRYESPSLQVIRVVAEPVPIADGTLEEGEMVSLLLGAANRDPLRFPDAERFDITRTDSRHVSLGSGIHFCLGAPLARLEAAVAVGTVLRRFPSLRFEDSTPAWRPNPALRGLAHLNVAWS
ncbi:cytochrome P450 [Chondromyces crocatus]|uniref:Cytochrome P450 n=1 Tax=Chondromyces crocatus TaxID=52 RepID=A0A0K1EGQ4_CHOCO|nr:cytochrome P450 [Chondromyces crocatus]AKT40029.1 cytochrome P450 [Chondromyces crocatus]